MNKLETLEDLREWVKDGIAKIGSEFTEPDDDWGMVGFLQKADGGLVMLGLHNSLFANHFTKDKLAEMLRGAMLEFEAVRYAVLFNVHGKKNITAEEYARVQHEEIRVSELADAQEMLMLVVGDAEEERLQTVDIARYDDKPPTLGEWRDIDVGSGRFVNLNERMREIV